MRSKRTQMYNTRTKQHIFTGGLKEDVAQMEMRGGELIDCQNYQEVDGSYHGYSSIPGYEVCDGTTLPSEVPIMFLNDYGNDRFTVLLLESQGGDVVDYSREQHTIQNNDVLYDYVYYKFFTQSFYFTGASNFTIAPLNTTLDLTDKDYTIDLLFRSLDMTGSKVILEKNLSYKLSLESGKLRLSLSSDGLSYTDTLESVGTLVAGTRYHVEVSRKGDVWYMFIDGTLENNTLTMASVFTNAEPLVIGNGFVGNMGEIRFCEGVYKHIYSFTIPVIPYSTLGYSTYQVDDVAREVRREEITVVPGDDPIRGVTIYNGDIYAVRKDLTLTNDILHKTTPTGWYSFLQPMNIGGTYNWCIAQFPELTGHQREKVLFFTTGVDFPKYLDDDVITDITSTYLPDNATEGFYANNLIEFKSRLFLAYPDGRLVFSAVDDPLDFDPVSGAGEIFMEDEITNMVVGPGDSLIIFCRTSTFIIKALSDVSGSSDSAQAQYKFYKETFSKQSGAFPGTAQRILGTVVSMGERGITNLEATDAFGDFTIAFLSKNVQVTLLKSKDLITSTMVHRANNQYRMFFSDGSGLVFTFDVEKRVKGVTKIRYPIPVLVSASGTDSDGDLMFVFGSTDGNIYCMDSGTSFNGDFIDTKMSTAYDSYQSPTLRKRFRKISLELKADRDLEILGKLTFDYGSPGTPRTAQESLITDSSGGIWGVDRWRLFSYGSSIVQNPTLYASGYGKNMSISIATKDKYRTPHILNGVVVEFTPTARVM